MKKPFYRRYTKDFLSDANVMKMTLEEEGAYARLLDILTTQGGFLPNENKELMRMIGKGCTEEMLNTIKKCFIISEGNITHPALFSQISKNKKKEATASKSLEEQCEPHKDKYPKEMIVEFIRYWNEELINGPHKGKKRWQGQDAWEIGRRLVTWAKNDKSWNKNIQSETGVKYAGSIQEKLRKQSERK